MSVCRQRLPRFLAPLGAAYIAIMKISGAVVVMSPNRPNGRPPREIDAEEPGERDDYHWLVIIKFLNE
ncbi:hypothetical protein M0802_006420 [Mischocyttarus mexicanus]|nr:hypothetical protein M0802_006420 [Mischocyttarus mexicanus]